jgi:hypothetical protein
MKKRIYISGKISGLPEEEYKQRFKQAEEYLLGKGYAVYNPVEASVIQETYQELGYAACLAKCIAMLRFCTHIYMLEGWESSNGAIAEKAFADAVGIDTVYENRAEYEDEQGET